MGFGQNDMAMAVRWAKCVRAAACASVAWLLGLMPLSVGAQPEFLPPELEPVWRAAKLSDDSLSLVVQEIGGPRLLAINADVPRNPASVMKLTFPSWLNIRVPKGISLDTAAGSVSVKANAARAG